MVQWQFLMVFQESKLNQKLCGFKQINLIYQKLHLLIKWIDRERVWSTQSIQ